MFVHLRALPSTQAAELVTVSYLVGYDLFPSGPGLVLRGGGHSSQGLHPHDPSLRAGVGGRMQTYTQGQREGAPTVASQQSMEKHFSETGAGVGGSMGIREPFKEGSCPTVTIQTEELTTHVGGA